MIDESSEKITAESFGGSATLPDATHVKFPQALIAENQVYVQGSAATRLGFGQILTSEPTASEVVSAMFNWISSLGNYLTYFRTSDNTWRIRNIAGGSLATIQTIGGTAYAMSYANSGARLYAAFFTSQGIGSTYGRVLSYQVQWTIAGSTLTNITVAANVATATTANAHHLAVGELVFVSGASVDLDLNATYLVTGTPTATTFTFATVNVANGVYNEATLVIASFVKDNLFQGPMSYTPSAPTEPGAGVITVGSHRLGYMIEFRSGFTTRPSPDSGATPPNISSFTPVVFTASGSKNLSWTLNTTWRTGAIKVHVIMSPVSNPNRYFKVPGANAVVIGGVASSVTIVSDISDEDLIANAQEVTNSLNFWTCDVSDVAPFNPSVVFLTGDRMSYITRILDSLGNYASAAVFSEIGKYQQITADQNVIQLPGNQDMTTGCSLADGATYLLGSQWTYRTRDNGQVPGLWPTPQLVSANIGSPSIRGICPSADGAYCWVASRGGLYLFAGIYPELPVSYLSQPTWDRINWAVPQAVQVKDNPTTKQVFVMACLDSATTPNYILTLDYTDGKTYDTVRFSLDSIRNTAFGAMEVVKNTAPTNTGGVPLPTSVYSKQELWLSVQAPVNGAVYQAFLRAQSLDDQHPWRDLYWNVPSHYRTALLRSRSKPNQWQHQGAHLRITGEESVFISAYGVDGTPVWPGQLITLSEDPGNDELYLMDLLAEAVSYDFLIGQNNTIDGDFEDNDGSWTTGATSGAGSWAVITGDPANSHGGTGYAKHTGANTICEFSNSALTFDVTPGEVYLIEIWTKATGSPDGQLLMGLEYFNSDGVSQGFVITPIGFPLGASVTAGYIIQNAFYTIPAGAAYVRPLLKIVNKTTGVWYVDDFFFSLADAHVKLSGIRHYLAVWAMEL